MMTLLGVRDSKSRISHEQLPTKDGSSKLFEQEVEKTCEITRE